MGLVAVFALRKEPSEANALFVSEGGREGGCRWLVGMGKDVRKGEGDITCPGAGHTRGRTRGGHRRGGRGGR